MLGYEVGLGSWPGLTLGCVVVEMSATVYERDNVNVLNNSLEVACVAWRFWLSALSNKGGRGQRNREEIGAGATCLFFSQLVCPARQNRHATQASLEDEKDFRNFMSKAA